jgi:lycopene cyclase domain-containing protein
VLNLAVTIGAVGALLFVVRQSASAKRLVYVLIGLLLLTAIFDSLIVRSGIVAYTRSHILGVYIGKAPIEDFFYAVVAAILAPLLWDYYERKI